MNMQNKIHIVAEDIGNGSIGGGACLGTAPSQDRLEQLEGLILNHRLQYVPVGLALDEINKKGYYKKFAETFEAYMENRFGMTAREGYHLISSAKTAIVVDDYDDDPLKMNHGSGGKPIILDNERKARALAGLTFKDKIKAANDAYQKAVGEKRALTARDIEEEAAKYKTPKKSKFLCLDEVKEKIDKVEGKEILAVETLIEKNLRGDSRIIAYDYYISLAEESLQMLKSKRNGLVTPDSLSENVEFNSIFSMLTENVS